MLRADTGNFNKLLTSLGFVALAAALVIPYFYFRNTSILEIPAGDLRAMTATGRSALEARQDGIVDLEPWVIGGAILLASAGFTLLVAGAVQLRYAQRSEDEESELRRRRARLEVEEMSPAEQEELAAEKAEVEDEVSEAVVGSAAGGPAAVERTEHRRAGSWSRVSSRLDDIRRISSRIEEVLRESPPEGFHFKSQLRIGSATGAVRLDGLFESRDARRPDIVLQTQVPRDARSLVGDARIRADGLIASVARYEALTQRKAFGWLIAVVPDDGQGNELLRVGSGYELIGSLRAALKPLGEAVLIEEDSLSMLPDLFSRRFGAA